MKFCAFLLVSLVAACYAVDPIQLTDEQRQRVRSVGKDCIAQEGTTPEAVQNLRNGNFEGADRKTKCFANCFLEKITLLKDGKPQEDVIKEKLGAIVGQDQINIIMQQCNGQSGADNCETAFKLYQCYYNNKAAILQ